MEIRVQDAPLRETDAALYFMFEDEETRLPGLARALDEIGGSPAGLEDAKGEKGKVSFVYAPAGSGVKRLVIAGLGKRDAFDLICFRDAVAAALRCLREKKLRGVSLVASAFEGLDADAGLLAREAVVAARLGLYRYLAFKTENNDNSDFPESLTLCGVSAEAVAEGEAHAAGVMLARDLVNAPSNEATPRYMAETAMAVAERYGFTVTVFGPDEIEDMGMGAFMAVAQGSRERARFIILDSDPKSKEKPLVFVGKGVTFDTGGISIKPSAGMEKMKTDMAGAAAVIGFFETLGRMQAGRRVVGLVPCTDNMPGGNAVKPGDVVRAYSGKTVEIINTDAEGRLLLIDALAYAAKYEPETIVDLATLTGACVVALGGMGAGLFGNDDALVEKAKDVGLSVGEHLWPMPMWDFYKEGLKSDTADLKNVGPREGGAINAALFLQEFVPEGAKWMHLDIAGPGRSDRDSGIMTKGGSGFGVRTLVELALGDKAV